MEPLLIVGALIAVVVTLIVLEGRRQARKLGEEYKGSTGTDLMGAGMLELQGHLQPDRKVEVIREERRDADRVNPVYRPGHPGEGDGEGEEEDT